MIVVIAALSLLKSDQPDSVLSLAHAVLVKASKFCEYVVPDVEEVWVDRVSPP